MRSRRSRRSNHWACRGRHKPPFLFCIFHQDTYPKGNDFWAKRLHWPDEIVGKNFSVKTAETCTTPQERHSGKDIKILAKRKLVYKQAKLENPCRWSGDIKNY